MQVGQFKIFHRKYDNKLVWTFANNELANPFLILWRLFWWAPVNVVTWILFILILIQQGKYSADEFMSRM